MQIILVFLLHLWYGDGSGEEVVEIQPKFLSPDMLRIIGDAIYPYHANKIHLDGNKVYVNIVYPDKDLEKIGSWLDGIDVNRNAPDLWMEGDLGLPEYPDAEFVPTLVSCCLEF